MHQKLELRNGWSVDEYRCDITRMLDEWAGLSDSTYYHLFYHYILADELYLKENSLAIRVPGGTVGIIRIDKDKSITEILVDTEYVVKTYPKDINDKLQKYLGDTIVWENEPL